MTWKIGLHKIYIFFFGVDEWRQNGFLRQHIGEDAQAVLVSLRRRDYETTKTVKWYYKDSTLSFRRNLFLVFLAAILSLIVGIILLPR